MKTKGILFTGYKKAELVDQEVGALKDDEVLVKMEYTAVSAGTEKANLLATPNRGDIVEARPLDQSFPAQCGYSGVGEVLMAGSLVTHVAAGDRVVTSWGHHRSRQRFTRQNVIPVDQTELDSRAAAYAMICGISLGGVRKARPEIGESVLVMGQGVIGIFATAFARIGGMVPVIAADTNPGRLALAQKMGADYVVNPASGEYAQRIKEITRGQGARVVVEATGIDAALGQALDCVARQGRISLLGCTRVPDSSVNFYQKVHRTGVSIIGAHTMVKPDVDSYPGYWTCQDDMAASLDLMAKGRLDMQPFIQHVYAPDEAPEVFASLCDDPDFPVGVLFDWRGMRE